MDLQLHIAHYNTAMDNISHALDKDRGLAVLGFFFVVGDVDNSYFDPILNALNGTVLNATGTPIAEGSVPSFSLQSIIPTISSLDKYFRYSGCLTSPACYESVIWTVFESTIPISNTQIDNFRQIISHNGERMMNNFRPTQDLYSRNVTTSDSNFTQLSTASHTTQLPTSQRPTTQTPTTQTPTTQTPTTQQPTNSATSITLSFFALCVIVYQYI
ncbi:unnamed protein product [Owenia fusiformis]|uniref:carbonic anhydrase n=1 Tax=Owenia fusiformis TaxID=6347 RepID=A0A8J1TN80_OWEFU|nr:unnamed protein product [Owenia fusiformis]